MKTSYNLSCIGTDGLRVLVGANQGRHFHATEVEAEAHLANFLANNSEDRLASIYGKQAIGTFRVDAFECYGNGDATGIYVGGDKLDRAAYMAGNISHDLYYSNLADVIGRDELESMVRPVIEGYSLADAGPHMNDIPLRNWDRLDYAVRNLVSHKAKEVMTLAWPGHEFHGRAFSWSLSETVCVTKAVALRMLGGKS